MKKCPHCGKTYPADTEHFHRDKYTNSGLHGWCKWCQNAKGRERYWNDPECRDRIVQRYWERAGTPEYRARKREEARRRSADPEYRERARQYYINRRDNEPGFVERRRAANRKKWAEDPEARKRHRQKRIERFANNPHLKDEQREYMREWGRRKYQTDPNRRLSSLMARQIRYAIGKEKAGLRWESIVGYDLETLKAHLESQFTKGMTWDNMGEWHIDHIRPKSHFHFESMDDPEFKACWSLWNLQPMWNKDNWSKNNRCDAPPLPLV